MRESPAPRVPLALPWSMLARSRGRLLITTCGVATATLLLIFQGSLIAGFMSAARQVIDSSPADAWLVPEGVRSFEFAGRLSEHLAPIAAAVPGVRDTFYVASGFSSLARPDGGTTGVAVAGMSAPGGSPYPRPTLPAAPGGTPPFHFAVETTSAALLGVAEPPTQVEIGGRRAVVSRIVSGFGTFMGSPFVFGAYRDAHDLLDLPAGQASFIGLRLRDGAKREHTLANLERAIPEVQVLSTEAFGTTASIFWLIKTGAGGGFLVAALLGLVVGIVVVSQTLQTVVLEHYKEFAVLRVLGATPRAVATVVVLQACIAGLLGAAGGLALSLVAVELASQQLVPWIETPLWLPALAVALALKVAVLSSLAAVRRAVRVAPEEILRT